ncbi:MAG: PASTA domain-containing protein, partial [Chlorobi bacterium]|nr:PASTA domain-containing protein [Chlorobiota bacterium]
KKVLPYFLYGIAFYTLVLIFGVVLDYWIIPSSVHNTQKVTVPDVKDLSLEAAEDTLRANGLKYETGVHQYNENIPPDYIVNQSPKAGNIVKYGRRILLTISKGGEVVKVPRLKGRSLRTARVSLMRKGLELGDIAYRFHNNIGIDTIIAQNLASGKAVPYGSIVDVIVSKGSENQVLMPRLVGLSIEDAELILTESGLFMGIRTPISKGTYEPNTVVSQSPAEGEIIQQNTIVNITYSL